MNIAEPLVQIGKRIRAWTPFNYVATTVARGLTSTVGWQPDFLPRHLHKVGRVICALPNGSHLELWSRGDDWVSNRLFWFGWSGYEPETASVFAALASSAAVTLDIGAYVGFYSLVAARFNPNGVVHAFEPMPAIFARLANNIQLNGLTNTIAHEMAVGDTNGSAEFYFRPETLLPTSSSLSPTYTNDTAGLTSRTVRVIRLDDFIREKSIPRVDLMKIDTETTEVAVLRGAKEMLSRDRPHIFCEVLHGHDVSRSLFEFLAPLRYNYFLLTPDGPVQKTKIESHPEFLNYLFTTLSAEELRSHIKR